jgi:hypothetical protein
MREMNFTHSFEKWPFSRFKLHLAGFILNSFRINEVQVLKRIL